MALYQHRTWDSAHLILGLLFHIFNQANHKPENLPNPESIECSLFLWGIYIGFLRLELASSALSVDFSFWHKIVL